MNNYKLLEIYSASVKLGQYHCLSVSSAILADKVTTHLVKGKNMGGHQFSPYFYPKCLALSHCVMPCGFVSKTQFSKGLCKNCPCGHLLMCKEAC